MSALLHVPLDFELREEVRSLAMGSTGDPPVAGDPPASPPLATALGASLAVLYTFRLWCDYGRAGTDWRPLGLPMDADWRMTDFKRFPLAGVLENYCGWKGEAGVLIHILIAAGVLVVEQRGGASHHSPITDHRSPSDRLHGLTLTGFARFNEHLLPGYRSQWQKGGHATAARKHRDQLVIAAAQQQKMFEQERVTLFDEKAPPSKDESQAAILLVMQLDTACGRSLRTTREYTADKTLMAEALRRARTYTRPEIDLALRYLDSERLNPAVPKDSTIILRDFEAILEQAKLCA